MLALVLDIVRTPVFPEQEVAKRTAECLSAIRQDEDNPSVRAVETLFELLYGASHPYGRKAKGTVETRRAHHARRPGGVPCRAVQAGGAVAGDRR